MMEYTVLNCSNTSDLNHKVKEMIKNGWIPVGSHVVTVRHIQNKYAGSQHMSTITDSVEYTQTMVKENEDSKMKLVIDSESVDIYIDNGENEEPTHIVYWRIEEIEEDANVALSVANAIHLFYTDKKELLKLIGLNNVNFD